MEWFYGEREGQVSPFLFISSRKERNDREAKIGEMWPRAVSGALRGGICESFPPAGAGVRRRGRERREADPYLGGVHPSRIRERRPTHNFVQFFYLLRVARK
jgi:hypothetical protein